jgi:hypothetical protein
MSSTVEGLDRGVMGTAATIEKMHRLVALGKLDPTLQKIASWIRLQVPGDRRGKTTATADAIFAFCRDHGVFQSDPFQIEKIEHPIEAFRAVIQAKNAGTYRGPGLFIGDCDTFAIVTATLGGILGFQYAFETAKVDASRPDEYSHVWTDLLVEGNWYALDSSTQGAYPGWKPPVGENMLKLWSEHPIENVVKGSDMRSLNGGLLGDQTSPLASVDTAYPQDYVGYGIPKDFGAGPCVIPEPNFDSMELLPPHETQIPDADLRPDMHLLKAAPTLDPSERIQSIAGYPNDHGNPYYKTSERQPYYKVERQPYPPGSPWNGKLGQDTTRFVRTGAHIKIKSAESPERQVRTKIMQPMMVKRRTNVMVTPRRIPFGVMEGYGMGDEDMPDPIQPSSGSWTDSLVTSLDTPKTTTVAPTKAAAATPTTQNAAAAGSSVWDAVSSVFKAAGSIAPSVMQTKLAQTVVNATNKLAGKSVVGVQQVTPWYANPFILGAGLVVLGGGTYVLLKSRTGSSRRRRR